MLDESDLDFTVLATGGGGGGCIGGILSLIVIGVVWYFVHQNTDECEQKHCDHGKPVLMHHECLCVDEAK